MRPQMRRTTDGQKKADTIHNNGPVIRRSGKTEEGAALSTPLPKTALVISHVDRGTETTGQAKHHRLLNMGNGSEAKMGQEEGNTRLGGNRDIVIPENSPCGENRRNRRLGNPVRPLKCAPHTPVLKGAIETPDTPLIAL